MAVFLLDRFIDEPLPVSRDRGHVYSWGGIDV